MPCNQRYLLGIDTSINSLPEAIEQLIALIEGYAHKSIPHYIAAVDGEIINTINSWLPAKIRQGEIASELRHANMAFIEGHLLTKLNNAIETAPQEAIKTEDLLIPLAQQYLEPKQRAVYLLGSNETEVKKRSNALQLTCPQLAITTAVNTHLAISGDRFLEAPERDALLIEHINTAKPDLLVIYTDSITATLWFARVKQQLKVPLSIHCLSTAIPAHSGYASYLNTTQLIAMAVPAICYQRLSHSVYHWYHSRWSTNMHATTTRLFASNKRTIAFMEMPTLIDRCAIQDAIIEQAFAHDYIVIDFRHVRHITLAGISFLMALWQHAYNTNKIFCGLAMNGDMRLLLKINRAWDTLGVHQYKTVQELLTNWQQSGHTELYQTIEQNEYAVIASFFGPLDNRQDYDRLLQQLLPMIKERSCVLDFTYCTDIESHGFSFLLALQKELNQQDKQLRLYALNTDLKKQLKQAQLLPLLKNVVV
jgi:anti-anti-sigma regulatory factor/UDP-N-acetyl-D-mannosaminuronic acid transferase (WecB/TagA/CpsF family)